MKKEIVIKPLSGVPWFLIAGLVLLVCKLTAYPALSWWWIVGIGFAPLWFSLFILAFVCFIALGVLAFFALMFLFGMLFGGRSHSSVNHQNFDHLIK